MSPSVVEFVGSAPGREIAKVMVMSAVVSSQTQNGGGKTTPVLPMGEGFDESNNNRHWKMIVGDSQSIADSSNASVTNRQPDGTVDLTPLLGAIALQAALMLAYSLQTLQTNLAIDHWPFKW